MRGHYHVVEHFGVRDLQRAWIENDREETKRAAQANARDRVARLRGIGFRVMGSMAAGYRAVRGAGDEITIEIAACMDQPCHMGY